MDERKIGPYEIKGEIGHGAMACVYRAWDERLQRMVAIKEPIFDQGYSKTMRDELAQRFLLEGRAAARLSHPNIVTVYAADEYEGTPAIVMELVEGITLKDVLARGPLKTDTACNYLDQLLDAVGYAHKHGVIHRDIKPDNIYITLDGSLKLGDFGIAHLENVGFTALTTSGSMLGTPGYMSPEQVLGASVDARSDLFSIGVVAYEMLVGHNPFNAANDAGLATIFHRIAYEPVEPIEGFLTGDVPAGVAQAITTALSKDPADRPQSALNFKRMLHGESAQLHDALPEQSPASPTDNHSQTIALAPEPEPSSGTDTRLVNDWDEIDRMSPKPAPANPVPPKPVPPNPVPEQYGTMTRVPPSVQLDNRRINGTSNPTGDWTATGGESSSYREDRKTLNWLPLVGVGLAAAALLCVLLLRQSPGEAPQYTDTELAQSNESAAEAVETEDESPATTVAAQEYFSDYSWDDLAEIGRQIGDAGSRSEAIEIAQQYNLCDASGRLGTGLTKEIHLTNGNTVQAQVVGIYHDEAANGGKAGLSFLMTDCITVMPISYDGTNRGWVHSDVREYLQSDALELIPEDLKQHIVLVKKYSNNAGVTEDIDSITVTDERLWLPSQSELCGSINGSMYLTGYEWVAAFYNIQGEQYQLFEEEGIEWEAQESLLLRSYIGQYVSWWQRSAPPDEEDTYRAVSAQGLVHHSEKTTERLGVAPGFCL